MTIGLIEKHIFRITYKEYMDKTLGNINEDKDEYELRFLDDNSTLAWISGADLILLMKSE